MSTKVIFHSGMPKTGTSIGQYFLNQMAGDGLINYYPKLKKGVAHHDLVNTLTAGSYEELVTELCVNATKDKTNIVSSESLSNLIGDENKILQSFTLLLQEKGIEPVYLVYLRELSSFIDSMFCQQSRFGKVNISPYSYYLTRKEWTRSFFKGLSNLKANLKSNTLLTPYSHNTDIIVSLANQIDVMGHDYKKYVKGAPNTRKFSLKLQVLFFYYDWFADVLDFKITRAEAINKIFYSKNNEFNFDNDLEKFTFFNKRLLQTLKQEGLDLAKEYNVIEYYECFQKEERKELVPFIELSPSILSKNELIQVRDYLNAE